LTDALKKADTARDDAISESAKRSRESILRVGFAVESKSLFPGTKTFFNSIDPKRT
jgi:hypothetical protein